MTRLRHKYGAKRAERAGYSFASKLEASVYDLLKIRENAGEIKDIQVQDTIYLTDAQVIYKPDFKVTVVATGEPLWIEAKGLETQAWRIKLKLWRKYGPGKLEIYKGHHYRPTLAEVVEVRG